MKQRDVRILDKIISEIDFIDEALDGVSRDAFNGDELLKRAVAMASINVGEPAKQLSDEFHAEHPGNELKMAAKTRDVYAHGYYSLSFDRVYTTSIEDYPRVRNWITGLSDMRNR